MQSTITLEKAKELVRDAVERFPNRSNPRERGWRDVCLYTGPGGAHCIAGQVLADLGLPLPDPNNLIANTSTFTVDDMLGSDHPFTDDAIDYIRAAQYVFDGGAIGYRPKTRTRRWSTALRLLEKHLDEALDEIA